MKKNYLKIVASIVLILSSMTAFAISEVVNLSIQNLAISYNGYNTSTKKITGINFNVAADLKSSSNNFSVGCKVILMLVPRGAKNTSEGTIAWSEDIADGKIPQGGTWEYKNMTLDLTTINSLAQGDYRLYAYVENYSDKGAWFNSSDYFTFTPGTVSNNKPDLIIESISYDFQDGLISNIVVKVKNIGNADAAASDIKFLIESNGFTYNKTESIDAVPAGTSIVFNSSDDIDFTFVYDPNTTYKLTSSVDPKNVVTESNEANNDNVINDISKVTSGIGFSLVDLGINVPNPISKSALNNLINTNSAIKSVKLYSVSGQESDLNNATKGIYVVKFVTDKGTDNQKLVIE